MFFSDMMTKKEREQLSYFLQYEYKFDKLSADALVATGEYRKVMETYNA